MQIEGKSGLTHAEDAGDRADPRQHDRHRGQLLHDLGQVVVDLGEVDVERGADQLSVGIEFVGQSDQVVIDVTEVDDAIGPDEGQVAVRHLVEDLALWVDGVADRQQQRLK